jgi:hypothetical protein
MPARWRPASLYLLLLMAASAARAEDPKPAREPAIQRYPQLRLNKRSLESLGVDDSLPPEINAGVIPRAEFQAVLQAGIGRFLRQVRIEPAVARGRFVGWRLLQLFANRSVPVLKPGDTVLRVNGRSIERPEEFKAVWDSLPDASELVLDVRRAGRDSRVHYGIAN